MQTKGMKIPTDEQIIRAEKVSDKYNNNKNSKKNRAKYKPRYKYNNIHKQARIHGHMRSEANRKPHFRPN